MPNRSAPSGTPAALPTAFVDLSASVNLDIEVASPVTPGATPLPTGSLRRTQHIRATPASSTTVVGIAPGVNGQELLITSDGSEQLGFTNWSDDAQAPGWRVNIPASPKTADGAGALMAIRGAARFVYVAKPPLNPGDTPEEPYWLMTSFAAIAAGS